MRWTDCRTFNECFGVDGAANAREADPQADLHTNIKSPADAPAPFSAMEQRQLETN
jgi:hypothetical protein